MLVCSALSLKNKTHTHTHTADGFFWNTPETFFFFFAWKCCGCALLFLLGMFLGGIWGFFRAFGYLSAAAVHLCGTGFLRDSLIVVELMKEMK